MRYRFFCLIFALFAGTLFAQNNAQKAKEITENPNYLYGEGFGKNFVEADQMAQANLISKISTYVNSHFVENEKESKENGEHTSTSSVQFVVNTYSNATLTNTKSITIQSKPEFQVLRYIANAELEIIFQQREDKIFELIGTAERALYDCKIGDALRYYYWSYLLLQSMQYPNKVYNVNGTDRQLYVWLPAQIKDILDRLNVRITDTKDNELTLYFTFDEKYPVKNLDFRYYNGNGWSRLCTVKDGDASIELRPGFSANSLDLEYEYKYSVEAKNDPEIKGVLQAFEDQATFNNSRVTLGNFIDGLNNIVSTAAAEEQKLARRKSLATNIEPIADDMAYREIISKIENAVRTRDYKSVRNLFTEDGWVMMDTLLNYGKARLLGDQEYEFYKVSNDYVVCRSLLMNFSFPNNNRDFTENVTFTFNNDNLIESLAFSLGSDANDCIFNKAIGIWSDQSKLLMATFLENYKTAFALKRLDYIKEIISIH